jgi:hypothetical protein
VHTNVVDENNDDKFYFKNLISFLTYVFIFFLCGYLESRVYFNKPNNLEDLRQRIRAEMEQISPDIIERGVQCLHCCVSVK